MARKKGKRYTRQSDSKNSVRSSITSKVSDDAEHLSTNLRPESGGDGGNQGVPSQSSGAQTSASRSRKRLPKRGKRYQRVKQRPDTNPPLPFVRVEVKGSENSSSWLGGALELSELNHEATAEKTAGATSMLPPKEEDVPGIPTAENIFSFGLSAVGFDLQRQSSVSRKLNEQRFNAHFGVGPRTIRFLFIDMKKKYDQACELKYLLLGMNWLKMYDTEHSLSGRWKHCEDRTFEEKSKSM